MKNFTRLIFSSLLYVLYVQLQASTYFVAPQGNDNNAGTLEAPFASIQYAVNKALPGDIIYLRGGTFKISTQINITPNHSGQSSAPIKLWAYATEKPLLDFSSQPLKSLLRGFLITGDYWHFKGLEIAYSDDNGIKLEGNYNTIEQCVLHHCGDSGIQLGFGHTTNQNNPGNLCAYNKIINCDSYRNYDYDNYGSDADGFACKMHNGKGNVFYGCRAWENSDDAWDLFETDWPVEIHYCWAWRSGDKTLFLPWHLEKTGKATTSFQGNGNGIKLGGDGAGGQSKGTHIVSHCIAFNNNKTTSVKGFDQNSHKGGIHLSHCLAWNNGYNYMFETSASSGNSNVFINNVSIKGTRNDYEIVSGSTETHNTWNLVPSLLANASDYIDLSEEAAKAPRQADGSLPNNGFARLLKNSDLIDKGAKIGSETYTGSAPDLGPYEYQDVISSIADNGDYNLNSVYPNPFKETLTMSSSVEGTYEIHDLHGRILGTGILNKGTILGNDLQNGTYILKIVSASGTQLIKVQKSDQ